MQERKTGPGPNLKGVEQQVKLYGLILSRNWLVLLTGCGREAGAGDRLELGNFIYKQPKVMLT